MEHGITDAKLTEMRLSALLAIDAVEAQRTYHEDVDGTTDADEEGYDIQVAKYQTLIRAIDSLLA